MSMSDETTENKKEGGFRVIDRRGETREESVQTKDSEGPGFTMKEEPEPEPVGPEQIDFATLIYSVATSALLSMGLGKDHDGSSTPKNLPVAKQNIDILVMLKEKTKGNLSPEESSLLENLLTEVQLRFVEAGK